MINRRFSASRFWEICRREGVTAFNGQGEMLRILLKQPESDADRDNSVRVVVGAAAATDLVEQFEQRFDLAVLDAYGMTETGPDDRRELGQAPARAPPGCRRRGTRRRSSTRTTSRSRPASRARSSSGRSARS